MDDMLIGDTDLEFYVWSRLKQENHKFKNSIPWLQTRFEYCLGYMIRPSLSIKVLKGAGEAAQWWVTNLVYMKACAPKQMQQNGVQTIWTDIHWFVVALQRWITVSPTIWIYSVLEGHVILLLTRKGKCWKADWIESVKAWLQKSSGSCHVLRITLHI